MQVLAGRNCMRHAKHKKFKNKKFKKKFLLCSKKKKKKITNLVFELFFRR